MVPHLLTLPVFSPQEPLSQPGPSTQQVQVSQDNDDIMRTLMAHEKKAIAPPLGGSVGGVREDTSSSESEDDFQVSKPGVSAGPAAADGKCACQHPVSGYICGNSNVSLPGLEDFGC